MAEQPAQYIFDITNPIHYTVANNHDAVYRLITGKYNLPAPTNPMETAYAAEHALNIYGEQFANDFAQLHPDKDVLMNSLGHYGTCCSGNTHSNLTWDTSTVEALQFELTQLQSKLSAGGFITEADKQMAVDRIDQLKQLMARKQQTATSPNNGPGNQHYKTNTYILLGLAALALIFVGSHISVKTK